VLEEIRRRFGDRVAGLVADCSEPSVRGWQIRREAYLQNTGRLQDPDALLIIAGDKIHNLMTLTRSLSEEGAALWRHFTGTPDQQRWFYRSVAALLQAKAGDTPGVSEVIRQTDRLDSLVAAPGQPPQSAMVRRAQEADK